MSNFFEVVTKYKNAGIELPKRATKESAGYDLSAADDYIIQPYSSLMSCMTNNAVFLTPVPINDIADATKELKARPTLVSTGVKCHLDKGKYLELSVRSSTPLKYGLFMANGVGIIDGDYYNNSDNEGEIFIQLINTTPIPILIKKGDKIAQAIIKSYYTTENDETIEERTGGLGSTTK